MIDQIGILYDFRRDGPVEVGEALVWFQNGARKRVSAADLMGIAEEPAELKPVSRQSWGHVIQYLDGWAWGIAADGRTICLGREPVVRLAIANPKLKSGQPDIYEVIELERDFVAKESERNGRKPEYQSGRKFRAIKARHQRIRLAQNSKHRAGDLKRLKV